jgi:large subunit ribosomal protein L31
MKAQIHPKYFDAKVTCSCGNEFTVGATVPTITVDVCSACHPFYTGQMKFVDTKGRVDAFLAKQQKVTGKVLSKADRRAQKRNAKIEQENARPETFAEFKKISSN